MRKFTLKILSLLICVCLLLSGCVISETANENVSAEKTPKQSESVNGTTATTEDIPVIAEKLIEQVAAPDLVPDDYKKTSDKAGNVVRIEYDTFNYLDGKTRITKPAYVYLPYSYDENDTETRYNIIYLMHGWGGTAEGFLGNRGVQTLLDNMIAKGDIPPMIAVSPTFDAENKGQDFSLSVRELTVFHNELDAELIPAVEGQFHTYAQTSDSAGLAASREHRAFGGFSLGAVTTWYQFIEHHDSIKYFLPMSGDCWVLGQYGGRYKPKETAEYLAKLVEENGLEADDFLIFGGIGTDDPILEQMDFQMQEMLKMTDVFTAENLIYRIKQGGRHDFVAVEEYIYNALPVFFADEG
ncbi:MAG: hypothetical protein APF81_09980 [Desulfosporosinus sp. BRH_c37]|nr:MAG: hypothetical protein APF81_09980 [Desulfosporosinus sp. BRH_c37]